jgi:hypothetical protein
LKNAIHVGHSTGGGEVARYIGRQGYRCSAVDRLGRQRRVGRRVRWLTTQSQATVGSTYPELLQKAGISGRFIRTIRSSPPGQNQGTGGDEKSANSLASRQALVQKQGSKGHGHDHAELVDRCNL